jgi:hypothetical protein
MNGDGFSTLSFPEEEGRLTIGGTGYHPAPHNPPLQSPAVPRTTSSIRCALNHAKIRFGSETLARFVKSCKKLGIRPIFPGLGLPI